MAMAPEQIGIGIRRLLHRGRESHPYDTVEWERREARIPNFKDGTDAFLQPDVEFPRRWSQNATNIVAQKYFRGTLGTPEREYVAAPGHRPRRRHDHRVGRARRLLRRRRRRAPRSATS